MKDAGQPRVVSGGLNSGRTRSSHPGRLEPPRPPGAGARRPGRRRQNNSSAPRADQPIALARHQLKPLYGTQHWLVLNRPPVAGFEVTGDTPSNGMLRYPPGTA